MLLRDWLFWILLGAFAETLISRSVAAPALENRFRARDQGTDFHEPAFFNQLVDFSDSCSDDSRSCHAALLGENGSLWSCSGTIS